MSLKIALLTNYPIVDNVEWKKTFVQESLKKGYTIDLFYGKKDYKSLFLSFLKKRKYSNNVSKKVKSSAEKNVTHFKKLGLLVLSYKSLNSNVAISEIKEGKYDIIVTALDQILSKNFINKVNAKIINVHYGMLPQIKGVSALEWTYFKYKKCEITLHYINSGIDTGGLISKKEVSIETPLSFIKLRSEVQKKIPILLEEFLYKIANNKPFDIGENNGGDLYTFMHTDFVEILEKNR